MEHGQLLSCAFVFVFAFTCFICIEILIVCCCPPSPPPPLSVAYFSFSFSLLFSLWQIIELRKQLQAICLFKQRVQRGVCVTQHCKQPQGCHQSQVELIIDLTLSRSLSLFPSLSLTLSLSLKARAILCTAIMLMRGATLVCFTQRCADFVCAYHAQHVAGLKYTYGTDLRG